MRRYKYEQTRNSASFWLCCVVVVLLSWHILCLSLFFAVALTPDSIIIIIITCVYDGIDNCRHWSLTIPQDCHCEGKAVEEGRCGPEQIDNRMVLVTSSRDKNWIRKSHEVGKIAKSKNRDESKRRKILNKHVKTYQLDQQGKKKKTSSSRRNASGNQTERSGSFLLLLRFFRKEDITTYKSVA